MQAAENRPRVIIWIATYCLVCGASSLIPGLIILIFPSWFDSWVSLVSLHGDNFEDWAVIQLGLSILYFLAGYYCLRGSFFAWCFLVADPLSTIFAVFLLPAQHMLSFGPYPEWVWSNQWYSVLIQVISIINVISVPLSIIVAATLLIHNNKEFFRAAGFQKALTGVLLVTLLSSVIDICEITSLGTILGLTGNTDDAESTATAVIYGLPKNDPGKSPRGGPTLAAKSNSSRPRLSWRR